MNNKMRTFLFVLTSSLLGTVSAHSQVNSWALDTAQVHVDGTSTLHDWTVQVPDVQGTLVLDGDNLKEVELSFGVATMAGGRGVTMDDKIKKALNNDTHPRVQFKSTQIKSMGNQIIASGSLNVGGVSRTIEVTCQSDHKGHYQATIPLSFSQFEIEPPSALFGSIVCGDDLSIQVNLEFKGN